MENLRIYVLLNDEVSLSTDGNSEQNQEPAQALEGDPSADTLNQILAQEEAQTAYIAFAVIVVFGSVIIYKLFNFIRHFL